MAQSKKVNVSLCHSAPAMVMVMIALISLSLALLTIVESDPENEGATYGFLMFAFMFGIPGLWLCIRGRKRFKHDQLNRQLSGYFKSHDSFTVTEMAQKIGKTEMETEQLIFNLLDETKTDLVFHRKTRQYFHKNRIHQNFHQIDRCSACGASLKQEIVFADEILSCQYCGNQA